MILSFLKEDYLKQGTKPSQLLISYDIYYEILKGDGAIQSCYKLDKDGKLGIDICGCQVYVVDYLDSPFKWLV
ncbi:MULTISPECIES: hypothetical protein [Acinetobacter]|uniref:hypothetical protein n=1 Tax=Acinetobacter TaxID=469 RepID=UPI0022724B2D|nr:MULTISPECIES: hypothetical protein [Acinetobacter]MDS7927927.1 hypothetical protein [Acinetobacter sp. V102_4]GLG83313.1 hypothetical protein ACSO1_18350 [Acinetobacter calcoaceticus]